MKYINDAVTQSQTVDKLQICINNELPNKWKRFSISGFSFLKVKFEHQCVLIMCESLQTKLGAVADKTSSSSIVVAQNSTCQSGNVTC